MKKKLLFITMIAAAIAFAGCEKNTDDKTAPSVYEDEKAPPYAASNKVWVFGEQTWSDAIHCPECDKESFISSNSPHCRSYTTNRKTFFYYNGAYAVSNAKKMCPYPWRIPNYNDILWLKDHVSHYNLDFLAPGGGYWEGEHLNNNHTSTLQNYSETFYYLFEPESVESNLQGAVRTAAGLVYYRTCLYNAFSDPVRLFPWAYQVRCVKDK
jgi:hypothetical protein